MADPCIANTACIGLSVVAGALQASPVVSPDVGNVFACRANGMFSQGGANAKMTMGAKVIPTGYSTVSFDAVEYQSHTGMFATNRLIAPIDGIYLLHMYGAYTAGVSIYPWFYSNGSPHERGASHLDGVFSSTMVARYVVGQYASFVIQNDSGSDRAFSFAVFALSWLGPYA